MRSFDELRMTDFRKVACVASGAAVLFALALSPLRAEPSDEERQALNDAEQSYKDGAFDLSANRVTTLLKKFPKTELLAEAELTQAKAYYQLGRSDTALAALNLPPEQVPANLQADTLFWQAESLLDLGKWPEAEQKYRALLALKDQADHADGANLGLAWALFKQGREADALPLIQAIVKDHPKTPSGFQAQLLLAKIELAKKQNKEAIAGLEALVALKPEPGLAFEADYWLGEAYAANDQPDQAMIAYERITGDLKSSDKPNAFPKTRVAQAYLGLGRVLHTLNENELAAQAYQQAYTLTENETTQLDAFRAYLESARSANQLSAAVAKLQEFAKGSELSAPGALLTMGSVLAEDGSEDKAIGILESLLVAYGKSPWVPAANYQLGKLYARTSKPDQAIKALQSCILDTSADPDLVRQAHFQLGNVLLQQTRDYAGAAAQFALVSAGDDISAENASYNFLLAQAFLGKDDIFAKGEADFLKRFPKSTHLKSLALAEGQLLAGLGKTDDAKAAYQNGISYDGGGPDQESLLTAFAELQYQTGDLEGTLKTYQAIVAQFPNDSLEAAENGVRVSYELKKLTEDQAETALVGLAQKYDKQPGAPEAYFRLGEFYYYRGNYVKAQDAFQQLTAAYPASPYVDRAYFYAGRAASAHGDYAAAQALLEKVPTGSPLKPEALLCEGRVYQQLGNFPQASALCDAVLAIEKTGHNFVQASLLKGECLFALGGTKDPANYNQALTVFDWILNSKEGTVAERNEAGVRKAMCLEKLNRNEDAMALYLDVLYGRIAGDDASSPTPPEFSWQIKAGWEAGRIRESQKDWRGAIEIYRRLEQIGGAQQQTFHDLVNKLRRDNYIYE
jgi:tetratricopeptide (TPR) repeat protein